MSDRPWFKFFPSDWRADAALRGCSPTARLLWLEMMLLMSEATPIGHLLVSGKPIADRSLAVNVALSVEEVKSGITELDTSGVFSRTADGVIFSRKMVRDARKSAEQSARVKKRWSGNKGLNGSGNTGLIPEGGNTGLIPHGPQARSQSPERKRKTPSVSKEKGFRLPDSWALSEADKSYARQAGVVEVDEMGEAFADYWRQQPGQRGRKLDWSLTWKTWVRNDRSRTHRPAEARAAWT